jgi:hypothetical protein
MAAKPFPLDDDWPPQRRQRSRFWPVVLVLAGGALVLLLVCGGTLAVLVYFARSVGQLGNAFQQQMQLLEEERQAHLAAYSFLEDCLRGHFAEAYARTSAAFQKRCRLEQLQELFRRQPLALPQQQPLHPADVFQPQPGVWEYHLVLPTANPKEQVTIRVNLILDGGIWKVDEVHLERQVRGAAGPVAPQPQPAEKEKKSR